MNSLLLSWEADCPIQFTVQKGRKTSNTDAKLCYSPLALSCHLATILQLLSLQGEQNLVSLRDVVLHLSGSKQVSLWDSCLSVGKEIGVNRKV